MAGHRLEIMNSTFRRFTCLSSLLTLMLAIAGCGGQSEKDSQSQPATATANPETRAAAVNLVNDPEFAKLEQDWNFILFSGKDHGTMSVVPETLPNGQSVKALKVETDQSVEVNLKANVPVSPQKKYRISAWLKQDPSPQGMRFFGIYTYDANNNKIGTIYANGQEAPPSRHFIEFPNTEGKWRQIVSYLMPSSTPDNWTAPADSSGVSLKAKSDTASINLFFLNHYNKGEKTALLIAQPTIEEVAE